MYIQLSSRLSSFISVTFSVSFLRLQKERAAAQVWGRKFSLVNQNFQCHSTLLTQCLYLILLLELIERGEDTKPSLETLVTGIFFSGNLVRIVTQVVSPGSFCGPLTVYRIKLSLSFPIMLPIDLTLKKHTYLCCVHMYNLNYMVQFVFTSAKIVHNAWKPAPIGPMKHQF